MSDPEPVKKMPQGAARLAGMGMELAGAVLGFSLLGYWIDWHWENERPWGLLICACLGIVGGLYNLIRKALHESLLMTEQKQDKVHQADVKSSDKPIESKDSGSPSNDENGAEA